MGHPVVTAKSLGNGSETFLKVVRKISRYYRLYQNEIFQVKVWKICQELLEISSVEVPLSKYWETLSDGSETQKGVELF